VFQLDLPDEVARRRPKERRRADDKPERIEEPLKNYHREMDMIRSCYPAATIDGDKPVAEVSGAIEAILRALAAADERVRRGPRR